MEKKSTEIFITKHVTSTTVLVKDRFALLVNKFAPNSVQHPHKCLVVHHSLLLQIQKLKHLRSLPPLVLLYLGTLTHFLKDSNLNLLDPLERYPGIKKPERVYQQINEKLLPLKGNSSVDILTKFSELLLSKALPIRRPIF